MKSRFGFVVVVACSALFALAGGCSSEEHEDNVIAINPLTGDVGEFAPGDVPDGWQQCPNGQCPEVMPPQCEPEACGPPLGMPNYECADGGIGGPTGNCIPMGNGCGWEINDCEPASTGCAPEDCGPPLGMPSYECADGSTGGPTGECIDDGSGTCGWEIRECEQCAPEECGPPLGMPSWLCDDGTIGGNTGNCLPNGDGTCGWEVRECPDPGSAG